LTSTYLVRSSTQTDAALLDWLRHYGIVLLLVTALGAAGAGAAWWFATPRYEMWTIAADTSSDLPDRQVGVVAQTLFQDKNTYVDADGRLHTNGLNVSGNELFDSLQLRSVPDSRLMIVVARGDDAARTAAISEAMANALSAAFERSNYPALQILGPAQPAPVESAGSLSLFVILGALAAFLLAFGLSIAHYRTRRPVLAFGTMMALLSPTKVVAVSARRRWLGALRHVAPVSLSRPAMFDASQGLHAAGRVGSMRWPGASSRRLERVMDVVGVRIDPAATMTVIVAEPASPSRELAEAASFDPVGTTTLLWLT
jgi:hypothetical protein